MLKIACLKPSKTKIFFGLALGAKRRARRPPVFKIDHYAAIEQARAVEVPTEVIHEAVTVLKEAMKLQDRIVP